LVKSRYPVVDVTGSADLPTAAGVTRTGDGVDFGETLAAATCSVAAGVREAWVGWVGAAGRAGADGAGADVDATAGLVSDEIVPSPEVEPTRADDEA
jgi:hypothetical protein